MRCGDDVEGMCGIFFEGEDAGFEWVAKGYFVEVGVGGGLAWLVGKGFGDWLICPCIGPRGPYVTGCKGHSTEENTE